MRPWRDVLTPLAGNRQFVGSVVFTAAATVLVVFHGENPLAINTLWGYIEAMRDTIKTSLQKRLNRIEGQVRGLNRMIEEDRYCIDIVTQLAAVRAALGRVEDELLQDHVAHCVDHAIASGDKAGQRRKIAELMAVFSRTQR